MVIAEGIGPILAHTECKYLAPLQHPDDLTIGVRVKELLPKAFIQEYLVTMSNSTKCSPYM